MLPLSEDILTLAHQGKCSDYFFQRWGGFASVAHILLDESSSFFYIQPSNKYFTVAILFYFIGHTVSTATT